MDVAASRSNPSDFSRRLFRGLPTRYNLLAEVLSFGQNARWRHAMLDHVVTERPGLVLDVACGPTAVSREIVSRCDAAVVGLDLSAEMLAEGEANVARDGKSARIALVLGRGEQLPFPDCTFDALTFTYLLRYVADPDAAIAELVRVVRPGGPIASMEFAVPSAPWWHAAWWGYTRWVLPIGGLVTGGRAWFDVGRFLGPSISTHYRDHPVDATVHAWEAAGVEGVAAAKLSLGGGLVMWGHRAR